jgi:predicted acylesterase/phospholipase RssA
VSRSHPEGAGGAGPPAIPPPAFSIAFEGCGCRAAFHVGAIEWLAEHNLFPATVAGASSGALVAAATAVGRVTDLRPVWTELFGSRVCEMGRLLRGRWPFRMSEIVGGAATKYFGDRLLADTLIPLSIVVTQLRASGFRRRALTAHDPVSLANAILASCFIPGPYSRMVPIDRRLTVDGAWLGRAPIREAAQLGSLKVIACVSDSAARLLRGALWTRAMAVPDDVDCRVLAPIAPVPVGAFDFDRAATLETFAIGRASAEVFADKNREWLCQGHTSPRYPDPPQYVTS